MIDAFPVGRRLAYDAEHGRLWVVCPGCGRWNLSPLEARWDAIEECERRFRVSPLRAYTDNIGLGRVENTLDLVRVGRPLPPEFASWRLARRARNRLRCDRAAPELGAGTAPVGVGRGAVARSFHKDGYRLLPECKRG